jgi:hypothetical protein
MKLPVVAACAALLIITGCRKDIVEAAAPAPSGRPSSHAGESTAPPLAAKTPPSPQTATDFALHVL